MERLTGWDTDGRPLLLTGTKVMKRGYINYEAAAKLARYEDAEEQERLVILPCKIGDRLYFISLDGKTILQRPPIVSMEIKKSSDIIFYTTDAYCWWTDKDIGKTVFLSPKEAESALAVQIIEEDNHL